MRTMTKANVVKAIRNEKGCGVPEAVKIYNCMTDVERKNIVEHYVKCGGVYLEIPEYVYGR